MLMKETLKTSHVIHEGSFMSVHEDEVILPSQKLGTRLYVKHPGGAAVLAITKDNKVILVKQYRYATGTYLLEIPAGKHEHHDEPMVTAKRELAEETGYASDDISLITRIYPTPGYSDEIIDIFIAKNAYPLSENVACDDDEYITVVDYDLADIKHLINTSKIHDAKTLIALQYYVLKEGECS